MRVLIVDDDPDVRSFLLSCITALGCDEDEVDTAGNGEEALGKTVQRRYDLVTLDLKMPGVSGIDILSVIRGMMPWSVIAIVSGYIEEVTEVAEDHADLILAKPVRVEKIRQLVELTRELMGRRAAIRALGERE